MVSVERSGLFWKALKVMILGNLSPGDYRLIAVLSNDLATTQFRIMTRWRCGNSGVALISAESGNFA
jgi:hypothetical protein